MFVIDRVELDTLDHPQDVRNFDREYSRRFEKRMQGTDEVVEIGNVCEDVVCDHKVGSLLAFDDSRRSLATQETDLRGNARGDRCRGDVSGRFDPQYRNAGVDEVPQQIAV